MGWRATRVSFDDVIAVRDALGCPEVMAWTLVRRGLRDPAAAREFLAADGPLDEPTALPGVADAAARLERALARRERVAVHGDYDCDGVCSTATLAGYLRARGGDVVTFLPSRFTDGYGIHAGTVDLLAERGADVLVCVDCGTTAVEPLERAVARGMDVVVLDHHLAAGLRPPGILANPALGPPADDAPAAVGVVYAVVRAMAALVPDGQLAVDPHDYADLVALATVADAVPLVGQNRRLVAQGLAAMRAHPRPGILALCRAAGIDHRTLDARHLGFSLAPSINAAGRLTSADEALDLVLADDADAAAPLAERLWALNVERRDIERAITDEAIAQVEASPPEIRDADAIVAVGDGWHEGVVGIVASRLVDRFERPAIVITRDGDDAKGSGRSLPGVDLHDLVARAADPLTRWGGHAGAVGLSLAASDVAGFARGFRDAAAGISGVIERARVRPVDAVVGVRDLDLVAAEALQALAPFGRGNPAVRLVLPACRAEAPGTVGQGRHLAARLVLGGAHTRAVAFSQGHRASQIDPDERFDAQVSLGVDTYRDLTGTKVVIERLEARGAPRTPDSCDRRCDLTCAARRTVDDIRRWAAAGGAPHAVAPDGPFAPPRSVSDLRGMGAGLPRVVALAGADAGVAVLVADVPRRRAALDDLLHPARVGAETHAQWGARCAPVPAAARRAAAALRAGVLVAEHGALDDGVVPDGMHVVVLDPPAGAAQAAQLARLAQGRHAHLVWGDEEVAFALAVAEARADVRGVAGALWRVLRDADAHPWDAALEAALLGDGVLRDPLAVADALAALAAIGLVEPRPDALVVHAGRAPAGRLDDTPPAVAAAARLADARRVLDVHDTLDPWAEAAGAFPSPGPSPRAGAGAIP